MKKILVFCLCVFIFGTIKTNLLIAPELFAYGRGYGLASSQFEIYLIPVHWENPDHDFLFLMVGKRDGNTMRGVIVQLLGEKIKSYPPYQCSTEYLFCYAREIKDNWRGWIEFRGQKRPLCGGEKIKDKCLKLEF